MSNLINLIRKLTMIWNISNLIWSEWCKIMLKWRSQVCNNKISSLEQTCQKLRKQHVATHIKFEGKNKL
jgi:hypothetical protein